MTMTIEEKKAIASQEAWNNFFSTVRDVAVLLDKAATVGHSFGNLMTSLDKIDALNKEEQEKTVNVDPVLIETKEG